MPGKRIKDLTALSGAGSANDDDVVIFDTTANETKRISRSQLAEGMQADVQVLTNKTIALGSNTVTGTTAQFNTALTDNNFATQAGAEALTNKTLALGSNTVTGTTAQFNTALTDNDFATLTGAEALTNKTVALANNTVNYNQGGVGASTRTVQSRLQDFVSVKDFGAVGDGVADDTAAIQAALTASNNVFIPKGTYAVSSGLIGNVAGVKIFGEKLSIVRATSSILVLLTCSGEAEIVGVTFDCNSVSEKAIRTSDNAIIQNCTILDTVSSSANSAQAIHSTLTNKDKGTILITNNTVKTVTHTNVAALIGGEDGAARAIRAQCFGTCSNCSITIATNTCIDVYGTEGDTIQVSDEAAYTSENTFLVSGNSIKGFNRRGIKVQAHNVNIIGNSIEDIVGSDPKAINGKYSIETASNNLYNVHASENIITARSLSGAANFIFGYNLSFNSNKVIVVRSGALQTVCLQYAGVYGFTATANYFETDHFVVVNDGGNNNSAQFAQLMNNAAYCVPTAANASTFLNVSASTQNVHLIGNTAYGKFANFVATTQVMTNCVVQGNVINSPGQLGRILSGASGAHSGCVANNNITNGTNQAFNSPLTGWVKFNNYHPTQPLNLNDDVLLTNPGTAIPNATGGAVIDAEARTALNNLLATCRTKRIIST